MNKQVFKLGTFTERQIVDWAKKAYKSGRARFEIVREKCALLVIDMQDEFVRPHWTPDWVPEATRQVPRIKKLIEHCRGKNVPVIFTAYAKTHHYLDRPRYGSSMPGRYPDIDVDRSSLYVEGHIWDELAPLAEEVVIRKPSYGAFFDTPLETILRNLERDTVIICGTLTNVCCGMTARQAYERSFKVVFGSDVTSTDDPDLQESELKIVRKNFGIVMTAAEIIKALN
ncbi:isochorismatase family protein [Candidatus Zixiibacteriota bacterium]